MFLKRVIDGLNSEGVKYALAGGYAVAFHGAVRGTVDIDIIVKLTKSDFEKCEKIFKGLGLVCKLPVDAATMYEFRTEYIQNKNLKVWSFVNSSNPTELVDILIIYDLRDFEVVEVRTPIGPLKLVSIKDLIKMKSAAGRPQDLADIEALKLIQKEKAR